MQRAGEGYTYYNLSTNSPLTTQSECYSQQHAQQAGALTGAVLIQPWS